MNQFRDDNTEGFTAAQLAAMNDEYNHAVSFALARLKDGADGATDDQIAQIKQSTAEAVLKRHGGA